jgi:hypothetical protein
VVGEGGEFCEFDTALGDLQFRARCALSPTTAISMRLAASSLDSSRLSTISLNARLIL